MSDFVTIFTTRSSVEADVVRGLLEANGMMAIVSSAMSRSLFPFTVSGLGEVRIAVHPEEADEARRIIDSHRTELQTGQLIRLRDEFDSLQRAIREFDQISKSNLSNSSINFVTLAMLVAQAALWREESRGGHFRSDFPERRDEWRVHSIQRAGREISSSEKINFQRA